MTNVLVKKAIEVLKEQRYYDSIQGLMSWDLWEGLSENGQPYRSEVCSFFTKQGVEKMRSSEVADLIKELKTLPDTAYEDPYEKAAVRGLIKRYDELNLIPLELQIRLNNLNSVAQKAWQEAIKLDSFEHYKPYLKELFELKKEIAYAINPEGNPFDVLCDMADEGIDTKEVGVIFNRVKEGIIEILDEIREENEKIDDSSIRFKTDIPRIRDMAVEVNALTGYDYSNGKDSKTVHGMCTEVGPSDCRIAISYLGDPWVGLKTMMHEGGHGRYGHNSCQRAVECGVWGGVSGSTHEGQARFYENMIGRSLPFIKFAYPVIVKHFPKIAQITPEDFYKMLNKVKPGLVRTSADELTYSLHPIIRFEIEKDYFEGKITTDDFERVWNEKYEECFGLTPTSVKNGVLQDIHWASGFIGYFQSYTIGNLYDGQLLHTMLEEHPSFYEDIEKGDFTYVNEFLYTNIHQYGKYRFTPEELLIGATGEKLNPEYYLEYLRNKYVKIH